MILKLLPILGLLFICSCGNTQDKLTNNLKCIPNKNGYSDCFIVKEQDTLLKYSINSDSIKEGWYSEYYEHNKLKYQGLFVEGEKVGEHKYFNEKGLLDSIRIYSFNLFNSKIEFDQVVYFTEKGDTAFATSYFVNVKGAKTVEEGERFKFDISLIGAKHAKNLQAYLNIVSGGGDLHRSGLAPFENDSLTLTFNYDKILPKGEYVLQGVVYDAEQRLENGDTVTIGEYMFIALPLSVQ